MGTAQSPILGGNKLKLGFFSPNCSSGMSVTKVRSAGRTPGRTTSGSRSSATRPASSSCCRSRAGSATAARRIFTAACSRPSRGPRACSRTRSASTCSPRCTRRSFIRWSRQSSSPRRINSGRGAGLNVVAGWNKPEYDAFGVDLPQAHSDRYALAQEWFDVVRQHLEARRPVRLERHVLQAQRRIRIPASVRRHAADHECRGLKRKAGSSPRATRTSCSAFRWTRTSPARKSSTSASRREELGRNTGVFTLATSCAARRKKEAEEYLHYYADENADWAAVDIQRLRATSPARGRRDPRGPWRSGALAAGVLDDSRCAEALVTSGQQRAEGSRWETWPGVATELYRSLV